jgi:hypothetical protein
MVSFNGRCRNNFNIAAIKNNPNFQEGVDRVSVSPLENAVKKIGKIRNVHLYVAILI